MVRAISAIAALAALPMAFAHPGETKEAVAREMTLRNEQHVKASRALSKCENSASMTALRQRAMARRDAKLRDLREQRGLQNRPLKHVKKDLDSLTEWMAISHNQTGVLDYGVDTPASIIFGGNNTCALVPETTIGPYYVTGEYIRQDITEGGAGVPLHFELQFVDINTCEPVPELIADVWHCNSTGVYSGVDGADEGGLNSTFLRGAQIADEDGVTEFDSIFPGHYNARVTHIHVLAQSNYTLLPNATYTGANSLHIGQVYFEDDLIQAVETLAPYTENPAAFTEWEKDNWEFDEATSEYDPLMEYVYLSDDISDGILAWITIGVDLTANYTANATAAANYYEGGGVANPDGALPPFNGSIPTGLPFKKD